MKGNNLKIFAIALIISIIGILTVYSSSYPGQELKQSSVFTRQVLWVILGIISLLLMYIWDYRKLYDIVYPLYALTLFLLILVLILGSIRLGAQRWIKILWFNFQPSELAKLVSVILLARYFSYKSVRDIGAGTKNFGVLKGIIIPFLILGLPMFLVLEQPDLGTAAMIFFVYLSMLFLSGVRARYLTLLLLLFFLLLPVFWHILRDYQRERLIVFLNPGIDPLGAGYTVIQSKIAIGSGGFFGKGWLSGTQSQLRFLPESHTDFIFATFAEERGFAGGFVLIFLYYLLISYGLQIASRANEYFGKLLASGISCMFAIQIYVNISMTLGIAPVVGLPLVLMSYGGSSILITFISIGILMNIDKKTTMF